MKISFFASFIIFCLWLGYEIHKHRNLEAKANEDFWEKEAADNESDFIQTGTVKKNYGI